MSLESDLASHASEIEPVAAAGIQHNIAGTRAGEFRDPAEQRLRHPAIMQAAPRPDGRRAVSGLFRTPVLRLQKIDVPTSSNIKRMAAWTHHPPLLARKRQATIADGT